MGWRRRGCAYPPTHSSTHPPIHPTAHPPTHTPTHQPATDAAPLSAAPLSLRASALSHHGSCAFLIGESRSRCCCGSARPASRCFCLCSVFKALQALGLRCGGCGRKCVDAPRAPADSPAHSPLRPKSNQIQSNQIGRVVELMHEYGLQRCGKPAGKETLESNALATEKRLTLSPPPDPFPSPAARLTGSSKRVSSFDPRCLPISGPGRTGTPFRSSRS